METLIIISIILLAAAVIGGGLKIFNVEIPLLASRWVQIGLGGVGLLALAIGIVGLWAVPTRAPTRDGPVAGNPPTPPSAASPDVATPLGAGQPSCILTAQPTGVMRASEGTIVYPRDGGLVNPEEKITGMAKSMPEGHELWTLTEVAGPEGHKVFTLLKQAGKRPVWPGPGPLSVYRDGSWSAVAFFGALNQEHENLIFCLHLVEAGPAAVKAFVDYNDIARANGYPGVDRAILPNDISVLDTVIVTRK